MLAPVGIGPEIESDSGLIVGLSIRRCQAPPSVNPVPQEAASPRLRAVKINMDVKNCVLEYAKLHIDVDQGTRETG
jgi:hypothetical protein